MSKLANKTIKEWESILLKAKHRDPLQYDSNEDKHIVIDAYNVISRIEEHAYIGLIKYLYDFLEDRDEYLREIAVSAFRSFRDEVPEFSEKALEIWMNPNENKTVRFVALGVWYGFYLNTCNKETLKILYKLLINSDAPISFRARAAAGILEVSGTTENGEGEALYFACGDIKDPNKFNASIDWDTINKIMQKYAPEALDLNNVKK